MRWFPATYFRGYRRFGLLLLLGCLTSAGDAGAQTTIVILARHAEQEASEGDPPLNPRGRARADSLVRVLERSGISAIYHTELRRTTETAAPLARALGLTPTVIGLRPGQSIASHAREVAADISSRHRGKAVLVVGHSNTIPPIIEALGVRPPPSIASTEFDHVFIVVLEEGAPARLIAARYSGGS